jgi:methionine aminopeptidase
VITQRGIITLEPGDFISIPNGVAFTDHVTDNSTHTTVLTFNKAGAKGDIVKRAKPATTEAIAELRQV